MVVVVVGGGWYSQRLLCLNPTTVIVVLLLGLWLLLGCDKKLGARSDNLPLEYFTQIICVVEFTVAAWNPNLTKAQITQIERTQKCALTNIFAEEFVSYSNALAVTGLCTLESRRMSLWLEFAKKGIIQTP